MNHEIARSNTREVYKKGSQFRGICRRFSRNKMAMVGLVILGLLFIMILTCDWFMDEESDKEVDNGEGNEDEDGGSESVPACDEASRMRPFMKSPLDDGEALQNMLLSLFPEFHVKLKTHPRTKRVVYAADVQSVFDICWYTLSRMMADDAPPLDVNNFELYLEESILSCLCCGDFFMRRSSTQKYCSNPNCQAERNRRKSKACRGRKGIEKKG